MLVKAKYELSALFIAGVIFSFLSHISDTLKNNPYENATIGRTAAMLLTKSIFGGIIAIIVFYGLQQYQPSISEELRIGISSAGAFLSEQISLMIIAVLKRKSGEL